MKIHLVTVEISVVRRAHTFVKPEKKNRLIHYIGLVETQSHVAFKPGDFKFFEINVDNTNGFEYERAHARLAYFNGVDNINF